MTSNAPIVAPSVLALVLGLWATAYADNGPNSADSDRPGSAWGAGSDEPGCTFAAVGEPWFPGPEDCRQGCCATHDECYADNGCTSDSWGPTFQDIAAGVEPFLSIATIYKYVSGEPDIPWLLTDIPGADATPECRACNHDVVDCMGAAIVGFDCENPGNCPVGEQSCYDRTCEAGRDFYCADDCYNPAEDPCETEWGDERCTAAMLMGFPAYTRFTMHGGAIGACVPFCYNAAREQGLITESDTTFHNLGETADAAQAVGIWSSFGNGMLCCFCGFDGFAWDEPDWPYEDASTFTKHNGAEGGHGDCAGCPDGYYDIQGCWNDGHMCATHDQGMCDGIQMCCG